MDVRTTLVEPLMPMFQAFRGDAGGRRPDGRTSRRGHKSTGRRVSGGVFGDIDQSESGRLPARSRGNAGPCVGRVPRSARFLGPARGMLSSATPGS